jgi:hypothetical protein
MGRSITSNDIQQLQSTRLVRFTDQLEQIVQKVAVVAQFIGCAFSRNTAALVKGFIEDTSALKGTTVVARCCPGALTIKISHTNLQLKREGTYLPL